MKLAYWMYAGPAHIGTLRIASSFKNVHAIMHAPLGDDYFNVMRSMLERERDFTPVTTSVVDRHVLARGSQQKVIENITRKDKEETPDLIVLTPTCTSSILQEDLNAFINVNSKSDVILADVNHYRVNELQAADRTLQQIVRYYIEKADKLDLLDLKLTKKPSVNIIGMLTLGFHNQHDCRELKRLLNGLGVTVNQVIPEGGSIHDLKHLPKAWLNIVPYREVGLMTAEYLKDRFNTPYIAKTPMGVIETGAWIREIAQILQLQNYESYINQQTRFVSQAAWFARSIDCQNLTGKKAVVFGDATHGASITRILAREMGLRVSCSGTYCTHDADWFREQVQGFCDEVLITDDHTQVSDMIARLEPAAIFGTQMERHIGKRFDIPSGVISAPVHIQNFTLGYRPFFGYEGTNQIADLVYNSFTLGMEDKLLDMFGGHDSKEIIPKSTNSSIYKKVSLELQRSGSQGLTEASLQLEWTFDAQEEIKKIPSFVRKKVKSNVEKYAIQNSIKTIDLDVMYAAKESFHAL